MASASLLKVSTFTEPATDTLSEPAVLRAQLLNRPDFRPSVPSMYLFSAS